MDNLEKETLIVYLKYLYELQESGVTNMFEAPIYLQEEFSLSKQTSISVFRFWAKNWREDRDPEAMILEKENDSQN